MKRHKLIEPIVGGPTPENLIIAVDFDGTICQHPGNEFPKIGAPVPHAIKAMKRLQEAGHQLMLWTMRDGAALETAQEYLEEQGIEMWWNENYAQSWSSSNKQYAHLYIDDAALGCPLVELDGSRAFVNWYEVEQKLIDLKVLPDNWSRDKLYNIGFSVIVGPAPMYLSAYSLGDTVDEAIERLQLCEYPHVQIKVERVNGTVWPAAQVELLDENMEGRV